MKIWFPYVRSGSGTDIYTRQLAGGLRAAGHEAIVQGFRHSFQYAPGLLGRVPPPPGTTVTVANSWNAFAFARPGIPLVVVEHLCIFDPGYLPYRRLAQAVFHEAIVRRYEMKSFRAAQAIVAVSDHIRQSLAETLGVQATHVIHNGVDTALFSADSAPAPPAPDEPFRLLYVGNLSQRKGVDLLPGIMRALGPDYRLDYTTGLRGSQTLTDLPNAHAIGSLSHQQLREAYRQARVLLFPSRLEGFGLAAAEAMACATPVVCTARSSLPEIVEDGTTGLLCPMDDVQAFVRAVRYLRENPEVLAAMGQRARATAVQRFSLDTMVARYAALFATLNPTT